MADPAAQPAADKAAPCPWCNAEATEQDEWGWLITHKPRCYWLNTHGDPIGRVRVNFSEVAQWNTRARSAAVDALVAEAWNAAIAIAKDYGRDAGGRAFAICDRYGADAEEASLEEAAQVAAENIVRQLTEARDTALKSVEELKEKAK